MTENYPGINVDDILTAGDWFSPVMSFLQETLGGGYVLQIDMNTWGGEPMGLCWYLGSKGVPARWPMVISDYLMLVVDQGKARWACRLLDDLGVLVENPPG